MPVTYIDTAGRLRVVIDGLGLDSHDCIRRAIAVTARAVVNIAALRVVSGSLLLAEAEAWGALGLAIGAFDRFLAARRSGLPNNGTTV